MINTNSLGFLSQFYFGLKENVKKIYQNSNFYEKKISKTSDNNFEYKPSPHLLTSIIKYQKKKYRIEDFTVDSIWQNKMNAKDYGKLNEFRSSSSTMEWELAPCNQGCQDIKGPIPPSFLISLLQIKDISFYHPNL